MIARVCEKGIRILGQDTYDPLFCSTLLLLPPQVEGGVIGSLLEGVPG